MLPCLFDDHHQRTRTQGSYHLCITMQNTAPNLLLQPPRLQDDILCELFYVLAKVDPPRCPMPAGSPFYQPASLGWVSLTHVCRRWRKIGLDLSKLWADIVCVLPRGAADIAQRTKDRPLNLDLDLSYDADDVWEVIQKYDLLGRAHTFRHMSFLRWQTRPSTL